MTEAPVLDAPMPHLAHAGPWQGAVVRTAAGTGPVLGRGPQSGELIVALPGRQAAVAETQVAEVVEA